MIYLSQKFQFPKINIRYAGFTLIEIMISLAILSLALVSLYTAQGNSMKASGTAEEVQVASTLAKKIMAEKMLEIEKELEKGKLPEDKTEESGEFEPPFDGYRWQFFARKVEIPLAGGTSEAEGGSGQAAPQSAQRSMAQIVTKKISESLREIKIKVIWNYLGEEQSLEVTTHVSRL